MKTIIHVIKKEFLQFKRDPKMFGIILLAPVIQLIFLGYAANLDVNKVKTVIVDHDKTSTSRNFINQFTASGYFDVDYAENYETVTEKINNGSAILAIVIPNDFEKKIHRKETVKIQALFDGSDGNTASVSAGYLQGVVSKFSSQILMDMVRKNGLRFLPAGTVSAEPRVWYNPELKTRNFMVPGIVALLLSIITVILTSLAIVKEKEIGTMEQLIVTPIKSYQLIIGKLIPFVLLGFVAVVIVLAAMRVIFNIPIKGDMFFLFLSSFFYILSTLGLGLFVSTISKTQQQAMMIAIFAVMMPMIFLSGFAFPIENMPEIIQWISYIIPLKYFITIIRGVILKGLGFTDLWFDAVVLLGSGILILGISSLQFQKKLE